MRIPKLFKGVRGEFGAHVVVDYGAGFEPFRLLELPEGEPRHSPTGYEWGYGGSGPSELARALLVSTLAEEPLVWDPTCYEVFKCDVVGQLPAEEWTLQADDICDWFASWELTEIKKWIEFLSCFLFSL